MDTTSPPISALGLIGLLHGLFGKLSQRSDLQTVLGDFLKEFAEFLDAEGGFLLSATDPSNLRLLAESGIPFHEESHDPDALNGFYNEIFRHQRPTLMRSSREGGESLIGVPLVSGDRLIGGMVFFRKATKPPFTLQDMPLLGVVVLPLAIHLENLEFSRTTAARRAELEAILASMVDGLLVVDSWGLIVSFNEALKRLSGFPPAELYALYWDDLLESSPRHRETFAEFNRALREGKPYSTRCPAIITNKSGQDIPISISFTTIQEGSGKITGGVLTVRDVTIETQIDGMKDEFIATVSHELRTPVTTISGFLEMMIAREMTRSEQLPLFEVLFSESNRLGRLINDMLDLSKIQSNRLNLDLKKFRVDALLRSCLRPFEVRHRETHRFVVAIEPQRGLMLADSDRIAQVLVNLISNAVKYSPEGGTIALKVWRDGSGWHFEVTDQGIGIPEASLPHVFDRFYRVNENQTVGSGLGLFICKEIVSRLGGQMSVRSALNEGSTFSFSMPLQPADYKPARPSRPRAQRQVALEASQARASTR